MNTTVEEKTAPVKIKKEFKPSEWQKFLKKTIDANQGKGMKLGEITKLASKSYKKKNND